MTSKRLQLHTHSILLTPSCGAFIERQKGSTTSRFYIQLDHFAIYNLKTKRVQLPVTFIHSLILLPLNVQADCLC